MGARFGYRNHDTREKPLRYEIHVAAGLGRTWSDWFDGLQAERVSETQTRLVGHVEDQSALHGVLAQIRDLGLEIISVARVDSHDNDNDINKDKDKDKDTP
jgi:hypothetical protein